MLAPVHRATVYCSNGISLWRQDSIIGNHEEFDTEGCLARQGVFNHTNPQRNLFFRMHISSYARIIPVVGQSFMIECGK